LDIYLKFTKDAYKDNLAIVEEKAISIFNHLKTTDKSKNKYGLPKLINISKIYDNDIEYKIIGANKIKQLYYFKEDTIDNFKIVKIDKLDYIPFLEYKWIINNAPIGFGKTEALFDIISYKSFERPFYIIISNRILFGIDSVAKFNVEFEKNGLNPLFFYIDEENEVFEEDFEE
jgi:hypothetical protein